MLSLYATKSKKPIRNISSKYYKYLRNSKAVNKEIYKLDDLAFDEYYFNLIQEIKHKAS